MRIAITGASGFCGSAVVRAATGKADVVCLGRTQGHRIWDATLNRPDLTGVDAVIHLAAAVGDPPPGAATEKQFRAVNVDGTRRLLDAADGRPVVWVSTASVYRPGPYSGPVREDHPTDRQRTAYGRTKAAGEQLALRAGAVVLRPRAVYGRGDPHLLPRLRRTVKGNRAWLPGPDIQLSLTAVENLADACLTALNWPPGAYNIADATAYSRDAAVAAVLGMPVRHVPLAAAEAALKLGSRLLTRYALDQVTDGLVLDIGKARQRGWTPQVSLWSSESIARSSTPTSRPGRAW
jgi:nucleoside-diphosphate-sugar epimerase